jgi:AraC-like DNA-binding protein
MRNQRKADRRPSFFSTQVSEARRFYLDLAPGPSERLTVVSGGCEDCTPDYVIDRSGFSFFAIEYVARGRGTLKLRGKTLALEPGTLFSYGPGIPHFIATDRDEPMVKYFVDYAGKQARKLLAGGPLASGGPIQTTAPGDVLAIMDDLIRNGAKGTAYSARICVALLQQLVWKIAETATEQGALHTQSFATYQRCLQYLAERFPGLHSLDQMAAECHVDKAYICRLFRRYGQVSPYRHLMRLKMNLAAERLLQPGIMVRQVADELRFSDAFHFSRAFRSVFGLSPRKFIALHRR